MKKNYKLASAMQTLRHFAFILGTMFLGITQLSAQGLPELMYFKFDNVSSGVVPNDAPVATRVSASGTVVGTHSVGGTGQFGTGLVGGLGASGTNYFNSGWTTNLTGSWTISLWLNVANPPTTRYYFGDNSAASFRCFTGGAASTGLRLTGPITCNTTTIQPTPKVVHYVYNSTTGVMTSYINGVADVTATLVGLTVVGTTGPFKIGGYATGNSYDGTIDEFRIYNRALSAAEVALTWNQALPMAPLSNRKVELFAGKKEHAVVCNWIVNEEEQVTGYEVERSLDGKDFSVIANVDVKKSAAVNGNEYSFEDKQLPLNAERLFYRIKIKDIDQMFAYTKTITLSNSRNIDKVTVYPFPFSSTLSVAVTLASAGSVTADIIDMTGKIIASQQKDMKAGSNTLRFDALGDLHPGVYFISIDATGEKEMQKIIKQ